MSTYELTPPPPVDSLGRAYHKNRATVLRALSAATSPDGTETSGEFSFAYTRTEDDDGASRRAKTAYGVSGADGSPTGATVEIAPGEVAAYAAGVAEGLRVAAVLADRADIDRVAAATAKAIAGMLREIRADEH